jgi:hypothetical protein
MSFHAIAVAAAAPSTAPLPLTPEGVSTPTAEPIAKSSSFTQTSSHSSGSSSSHASQSSQSSSTSSSFLSHFPTLKHPAPRVDSTAGLRQLCSQSAVMLSTLTTPTLIDQLESLEQSIQSTLARMDEFTALASAFRASNSLAASSLLPQLTAASATLPAFFSRIDRMQEFAVHVEACCDALEQRVAQAEQAFMPQKQTTVSKLLTSFRVRGSGSGAGGGAAAAAANGGAGAEVSMEPIDVVSAEDFFYLNLGSQPSAATGAAGGVQQPQS